MNVATRRLGLCLLGAAAVLALPACGGGAAPSSAIASPLTGHDADVAAASPRARAGSGAHDMAGMDMSGTGMSDMSGSQQNQVHGFRLNVPLARPSFVLTDTSGHRYDFQARTHGRATLLYFGYTDCPYQCPTTMADIRGALRRLPVSVQRKVTVVFVTTDPRHDTPAVLGKWLRQFDSRFIGLTGTVAQSRRAQQAAGVTVSAPQPNEKAPAGPASTAHGGGALAYGTDDYAHVTYPAGTSSSDLVRDLPRLIRAQSKH